jgi:hypothetical protein
MSGNFQLMEILLLALFLFGGSLAILLFTAFMIAPAKKHGPYEAEPESPVVKVKPYSYLPMPRVTQRPPHPQSRPPRPERNNKEN